MKHWLSVCGSWSHNASCGTCMHSLLRFGLYDVVPRCLDARTFSARGCIMTMALWRHGDARHGVGADKRRDESRQSSKSLLLTHVHSARRLCQCRSRQSAISDLSVALQSLLCQTDNAMLRSLLSTPAKLAAATGQRCLYSSEAVTATLFPGLLIRSSNCPGTMSHALGDV